MNFQHKKREIAHEAAQEIADLYVGSYDSVAQRNAKVSKVVQQALDSMWKYANSAEREKERMDHVRN